MHTGNEIEQFRLKYGFTILCIRTTLDMTEAEYQQFIDGRYTPATYQLIGFLIAFRCPLDSIIDKKFKEGYPIPPYKRT